MTTLALARMQFAFTIAFHYIYPPMSIGLGTVLVLMEGLWLKTRSPVYREMTHFWVRVFGLVFSIGVATGLVMEFEFGTNWATYSRYVGDVFGSALASEGIFAFFLESGFLALLLFGWDRISPRMHFVSTCLVAAGAHFSAIWIVVANSWMQTPAGFHIVGEGLHARAQITDFWAMIFNPSTIDRVSHVYMGAWQSGAWLVISVSAYYLLKGRHQAFAKASMKVALTVALVASFGQLLTGHHSAVTVSRTQPEKLAAFEGVYEANAPADAHVFGWVHEKDQTVSGPVIPGLLSFLVHGDRTKPVSGLRAFPRENWPPVNFTFQTYHLMIMIGTALILLSTAGVLFWWRGTLFEQRWLMKLFVVAVLGPQLANQAGWFTAEVGRQPWIVYHLLRTSEGLSKVVKANAILTSLVLFTLVYSLLFAVFIYLLDRKIKHGPEDIEDRLDTLPVPDKERA
jgi:cytochrome bd ubiquinol oxidase subunit I